MENILVAEVTGLNDIKTEKLGYITAAIVILGGVLSEKENPKSVRYYHGYISNLMCKQKLHSFEKALTI